MTTDINHEIADRERTIQRTILPFGLAIALAAICFVIALIYVYR